MAQRTGVYCVGFYIPPFPGKNKPFVFYKKTPATPWKEMYTGAGIATECRFITGCRHKRDRPGTFYVRLFYDTSGPAGAPDSDFASRYVLGKTTDYGATWDFFQVQTWRGAFDLGVSYYSSGDYLGGAFNNYDAGQDASNLAASYMAGDVLMDAIYSPEPGVVRTLGAFWVNGGTGVVSSYPVTQWYKKFGGFTWAGGTFAPDGALNIDFQRGSGYSGGAGPDPPQLTFPRKTAQISQWTRGPGPERSAFFGTPGIKMAEDLSPLSEPLQQAMLTTDAGASWSLLSSPLTSYVVNSAMTGAYDDVTQKFFLSGPMSTFQAKTFSSTDGVTWDLRDTYSHIGQINARAADAGQGRVLIDGVGLTKDAGTTWARQSNLHHIRRIGGVWWRNVRDASNSNTIDYSIDGVHWTSANLPNIVGADTPQNVKVVPYDFIPVM